MVLVLPSVSDSNGKVMVSMPPWNVTTRALCACITGVTNLRDVETAAPRKK